MANRLGFVVALLGLLFVVSDAHAQTGDEAAGVWLTQAGDARVRVSKCGAGICGAPKLTNLQFCLAA